jgi:membrane-bound serine protease (ClpP class)
MAPVRSRLRPSAALGRLLVAAGLAWFVVAMLGLGGAPQALAADPSSTPGASPASVGDPSAPVYVLTTTGVVDNVMAGYIEEGIRRAAEDGSPAVIVKLNTPGGALDSTQRIVSSILEAPLPTIVWVAPSGGRAASAGTFITLSANLAYMAPGTNIGAASPVGSGGEDLTGTIGEKVRNDAMKNITAIAEARGRPVEWAVSTVRDAASYSASEAVAAGAVDGLAASLEGIRSQADGQVVTVQNRQVAVDVGDAPFEDLSMNPFQSVIHLLSDPNVAFILLTLGFYGLLFELQSPNFVTGILGAIALVLAFIGFGSLPLNVAGLLLIGLAVILFLLEFTVTSHGLLAVGGLICFVLGAFTLYTAPGGPTAPDVSVAVPLILVMALLTVGWLVLVTVTVVASRRRAQAFAGIYGAGGSHSVPLGIEAVAKSSVSPVGVVYALGEEWTARTESDAAIEPGDHVRVVGQDGLTLLVEAEATS